MERFPVLPWLVVFDLDYTLWPLYCQIRSKTEMPSLFPHVKGILLALKDKGIDVPIASRSAAANVANIFLDKSEIASMFVVKSTGVPYNAMLFFDDDNEIIETISTIGVTSIPVDEGVNLEAFEEGLSKFKQKFASQEGNK